MTVDIQANTNENVLRIFMVRHGQTDHNVQKILQGHLDIDINATGVDQAKKVGKSLGAISFDKVVSSDLIRCVNTAQEVLKHQQPTTPFRTTSNLRERHMGVVQGMPLKEAISQYGANFKDMGEKKPEMLKRINEEFDLVIKQGVADGDKNVMLCTHGGVLTTFFNHLYEDKNFGLNSHLTPEKLKVPYNTSVSVVDIDKSTGKGIIRDFGNTKHLGADLEVTNQLLR